MEQVAETLGVEPAEEAPTPAELEAIAAYERRLADPQWTQRPGRRFVELGVKIAAGTHLTEHAHKAPGGLLRVQLLERDGHIVDLLLSGDFTCLPESGVEALAHALRGVELRSGPLQDAVAAAAARLGLDMPGVLPEDVAQAVLGAVQGE